MILNLKLAREIGSLCSSLEGDRFGAINNIILLTNLYRPISTNGPELLQCKTVLKYYRRESRSILEEYCYTVRWKPAKKNKKVHVSCYKWIKYISSPSFTEYMGWFGIIMRLRSLRMFRFVPIRIIHSRGIRDFKPQYYSCY
jgi:hypothetical protein